MPLRSSTIAVYQQLGNLQIINNRAGKSGGGLHLQVNPKLYILKTFGSPQKYDTVIFSGNHANYGGAVYVADDTNSGACSPDNECFIQTLAPHQTQSFNIFLNSIQKTLIFQGTRLLSKEPTSLADYWTDASQVHLQKCTFTKEFTTVV